MSSSGRVEGGPHFTRAYREVRRKASARRDLSRPFPPLPEGSSFLTPAFRATLSMHSLWHPCAKLRQPGFTHTFPFTAHRGATGGRHSAKSMVKNEGFLPQLAVE